MTKAEKKKLFERLEMLEFNKYKLPFMIMYYFGLRPCALEDSHLEGDFLIALNAKHKDANGERVYKKIPIPKQARDKINFNEPLTADCSLEVLNRKFKKVLEDQSVTQYYLRHKRRPLWRR